jgi:hypothetical protein
VFAFGGAEGICRRFISANPVKEHTYGLALIGWVKFNNEGAGE